MLLVTLTVTVQVLGPAGAFTPVPPTVKVPAPAPAVMVGAAPQVFVTPGAAAITRFAGNASLKVTPARAGDPAALVMVKVRVEACPMPIVAGANALESDGVCTVRPLTVTLLVTCAVAPMLAAVLLYGPPTTLEVTSTVTTHEACAALIDAPVTVMVPAPAAAVTTPVPDGHVVVTFGVAATSTLAGSVSVKLMPACDGLPAPLVSVKVSVEFCPTPTVDGANALVSAGSDCPVRPELVTLLAMRASALMLPAALLYGPPATLEVTSTRTWQDATALLSAAPVTVIVPLPAAAVTKAGPAAKPAPAGQLLCTLGVPATTTLTGSVSVKLMPDCAGLPAPLV